MKAYELMTALAGVPCGAEVKVCDKASLIEVELTGLCDADSGELVLEALVYAPAPKGDKG